MHRLRLALLLGGAVLLTTYISAPAAPTPEPARVMPAAIDAIEVAAREAASATQEAARLRARLAVVPEKPVTQRDPFNFGAEPRVTRRAMVVPEPEPAPEVVAPPPIAWPKLVALLTDKGHITAVLGVGDSVEMLKTGETAGGFTVREITATSIEVVHVATSVVTRLTLR
jgi:hypothetical protein